MKKILTVSLVAIMAVGAAHAKIASTDWTMEQLGATETTLQGKIDEKVAQSDYDTQMIQVAKDIASKVAQTEYDTKIQAIEKQLGADGATGSAIKELKDAVGTMSDLTTDVQTSLVGAINEVDAHADAAAGAASANATEIQGLKTKDTEIAGQITALQTADEGMSGKITALESKDTAIEGKIGTVTEGKTVVEMIADAQAAATYDDTAVKGLISAEETARTQADTALTQEDTRLAGLISAEETARTQADTGLQNQIGTFDETTQTWSGMKGDIADLSAEKVAIAQGQNHAVMTTDAAGNVIPVVPTECEDAESFCVLTSNGVGTYKWENIARATKTSNGDEVQD